MQDIELKKEELFQELIDLEKNLIDVNYISSTYSHQHEEIYGIYELLEQKKSLEKTSIKLAKKLIKFLKRKNLNLCYQKLKDIEKQIGPIKFAWLLKIIDKHSKLVSNENNINTIIKLLTRDYYPYVGIKWSLSELSTTFLNDKDIEFFTIEHLEMFNNCKEIYKSEILLQNKDFKKILMEKIRNNRIIPGFYYSEDFVKDMETIMGIDKTCDKNLLFAIGEKDLDYIRENLENKDLINIFIRVAEGKKAHSEWLTNIIEKFNQNDNEPLESEEMAFKRMQQIIALETVDIEILTNYNNLLQTHNELLDNPKIRTAMLNARSVNHQNRLIRFLQEKEIRDELLKEDSLYQDFLLKKMNELDEEEYGKPTYLLDSIKNTLNPEEDEEQKKKLPNIFNSMEYIYFYNEEGIFTKTSTTFYHQFLSNVYSGGYISQCMDTESNKENTPFYDAKIIEYYKEKRLIDAAIRTIEIGTEKDKSYDIEEEITWNRFFCEARHFIEEEHYIKPKQKIKEGSYPSLPKI